MPIIPVNLDVVYDPIDRVMDNALPVAIVVGVLLIVVAIVTTIIFRRRR